MRLWTSEYGTLWALELDRDLPPFCQSETEVLFQEVGAGDVDDVAAAMNLSDSTMVRQRLQNREGLAARRRCFVLKVGNQIATYGWVTYGRECVGELERQFNLNNDEAYLWDFATLPAWRGRRFYSMLLSHIIYQLDDENRRRSALPLSRLWIGASRLNQPSIQGFANAGFRHVVDVTYLRLYRLGFFWLHQSLSPDRPLVAAAHRILLKQNERRFGRLAISYDNSL